MSFITDHQKEWKCQSERGRCLHFSDGVRCNEIITAHSIQKSGQLRLIAEDGHVYRLSADFSTLRDFGGVPQLRKVGINKASAFAGFCKRHDNSLFEPIDNGPLEPWGQQIALYAYRSLCREYFVKENAVFALSRLKSHPDLDRSRRLLLKDCFAGHSLGLERLYYHKQCYDDALREKRYHEFEFAYFTSRSPCSIQLSGLLYPDFDFLGRRLQALGNLESPLDLITFFTAPTSDGWAFVFGWHGSSNYSCARLIQSLAEMASKGDKLEDALLRLSLSCCENHAIRISWWENLSATARCSAVERIGIMLDPIAPVPETYLERGCEGLASWSFEYAHTMF